MKKIFTFILPVAIGFFNGFLIESVNAQNVYIPDANFRALLVGDPSINTIKDSITILIGGRVSDYVFMITLPICSTVKVIYGC